MFDVRDFDVVRSVHDACCALGVFGVSTQHWDVRSVQCLCDVRHVVFVMCMMYVVYVLFVVCVMLCI